MSSVIAPANRIGLSRSEAASLIGVSPGTFDGMVDRGEMPEAKRIGTRRVWARSQVEAAFDRLPSGAAAQIAGDKASAPAQNADRRPPWERRPS